MIFLKIYLYAARYTFSAKEKDEETGYSYFGARYYNSDLSVWLSVDPMSDKYPSLSPYAYCANNPVKLVDPDGKEIVIKDESGDITFSPGQQCPKDVGYKTKEAWQNLDKIYGTEAGRSVIDEMVAKDSPTFTLTDAQLYSDNTARFKKDGKGGGTMYMNGHLNYAGEVAHELFHGYQEMKGQGKVSVHNEVEANLFSMMTTKEFSPLTPKDHNLKTAYGQSLNDFQNGNVNASNYNQHFKALCKGFISTSLANYDGTYSKFPSGAENKSLLSKFYH